MAGDASTDPVLRHSVAFGRPDLNCLPIDVFYDAVAVMASRKMYMELRNNLVSCRQVFVRLGRGWSRGQVPAVDAREDGARHHRADGAGRPPHDITRVQRLRAGPHLGTQPGKDH